MTVVSGIVILRPPKDLAVLPFDEAFTNKG